jgi:hypothetical protein
MSIRYNISRFPFCADQSASAAEPEEKDVANGKPASGGGTGIVCSARQGNNLPTRNQSAMIV